MMGLSLPTAELSTRPRLRARAARPADMLQVAELVNGFAAHGLMLPRLPERLVRHFREFVVVADDHGRVLGCAALRVYTAETAELAALAVTPEAQRAGLGTLLVRAIEEEARALGVGTIFALTLQEFFFHRVGFRTIPRRLFPDKQRAGGRIGAARDVSHKVAVMKRL